MIIIGHILMLLLVRIDGQSQIKYVKELDNLVGVKVPNKDKDQSVWRITDAEKLLIIEPMPNNEMY
jgi:hypothetical protein